VEQLPQRDQQRQHLGAVEQLGARLCQRVQRLAGHSIVGAQAVACLQSCWVVTVVCKVAVAAR